MQTSGTTIRRSCGVAVLVPEAIRLRGPPKRSTNDRFAGVSGSGETRTRTGDTTIFSRAAPLLRQACLQGFLVVFGARVLSSLSRTLRVYRPGYGRRRGPSAFSLPSDVQPHPRWRRRMSRPVLGAWVFAQSGMGRDRRRPSVVRRWPRAPNSRRALVRSTSRGGQPVQCMSSSATATSRFVSPSGRGSSRSARATRVSTVLRWVYSSSDARRALDCSRR
jgi:hypothetical protein